MELITQKNTKNDGGTVFCRQQSGNRKEHNSLKVSTVCQRRQHFKCISRMCQQKTLRNELCVYHDL